MLAQNIPISYHTEANGFVFFTLGVSQHIQWNNIKIEKTFNGMGRGERARIRGLDYIFLEKAIEMASYVAWLNWPNPGGFG